MTIDWQPNGERIAFASSQGGLVAQGSRWSELSVWFDADNRRKPYTAMAEGHSTYPGERTKRSVLEAGTLARALKLFGDETMLARNVSAQAEDWAEERQAAAGAVSRPREKAGDGLQDPAMQFSSDEEALRWLYGDELDKATPATLLARDFGAGEGTVRAAIVAGREIKVPFAAIARFVDRQRFREARNG